MTKLTFSSLWNVSLLRLTLAESLQYLKGPCETKLGPIEKSYWGNKKWKFL